MVPPQKCTTFESTGQCINSKCKNIHALCKYHVLYDKCREGDECKFVHTKVIPGKCRDFTLSGSCKNGLKCKFHHIVCPKQAKCKDKECMYIHDKSAVKVEHQSKSNAKKKNKKNKKNTKVDRLAKEVNATDEAVLSHVGVNDEYEDEIISSNMSDMDELRFDIAGMENIYLLDTGERQMVKKPFNALGYLKEQWLLQCNIFDEKLKDLKDLSQENVTRNMNRTDTYDKIKRTIEEKRKLLYKQRESFAKAMARLAAVDRSEYPEEVFKAAVDREVDRCLIALPIYAYRDDIIRLLDQNDMIVLIGETGSGKSTQIVQYLLEQGYGKDKKIVCTQQRKIAIASLSLRVSQELKTTSKSLVSGKLTTYSKASPASKLIFMTDRLLMRELKVDKYLDQYAVIVLDEAHERSLFTDILLCELKRAVKIRRESDNPLKVIVASATIDQTLFSTYLNCPFLLCPGQLYPVEVFYEPSTANYEQQAIDKVMWILNQRRSMKPSEYRDILVFLATPEETERARKKTVMLLESRKLQKRYQVMCLHSRVTPDDQQRVFQPLKYQRKIIFCTNIAETSLTIHGITDVIDTGRYKGRLFDLNRNISILRVNFISQSSANQRKGRAGRTSAGRCFRLYEQAEYNQMDYSQQPDILRMHLGTVILQLLDLGVSDIEHYDLIEKPSVANIENAYNRLNSLDLIKGGSITEKGRIAAELYMEPSISRMIIEGLQLGVLKQVLLIASMMTVSHMLYQKNNSVNQVANAEIQGDLFTLMNILNDFISINGTKRQKAWCNDPIREFNMKALVLAQETFKELYGVMNKFVSKKKAVSGNTMTANPSELIIRCICSGLHNNLAYYNGKLKNGTKIYKILELDQEACVHPSSVVSVLTSDDNNIKFILFNELMRTDYRLYMKNLTPINPELIETYTKYDLESFTQSVKEELSMSIAPSLVTTLQAREGELLEVLETVLGSVVELDGNIIRADVAQSDIPRARTILQTYLDLAQKRLDKELVEYKPNDSINTRVIMKAGLEVHTIILDDEYIRINFKTCSSVEESSMFELFSSYGEVLDMRVLPSLSAKAFGYITYATSQAARSAYLELNGQAIGDCKLEMYPSSSLDGRTSRVETQILKATWFTRKSRGFGFITCESMNDVNPVHLGLQRSMGRNVRITRDNKHPDEPRLMIVNLDPYMDEFELKRIASQYGEIRYADIARVNSGMNMDEEIYSATIRSIFSQYGTIVEIDIRPVMYSMNGKEKPFGTAIVKYSTISESQKAVNALNKQRGIFGTGYFYLHQEIIERIKFPSSVNNVPAMKKHIAIAVQQCRSRFQLLVDIRKVKNTSNTSEIKLKGQKSLEMRQAVELFDFLEPRVLQLKFGQFRTLESKATDLKQLEHEHHVVISRDSRSNEVKIYGRNRMKVETILMQLLDREQELKCEVKVRSLKAIIGVNGATFQEIKKKFRGDIEVDVRNSLLILRSTKHEVSIFEEEIRRIEEEYHPKQVSEAAPKCLICLCDLDSDSYTLSSCNHTFCSGCLKVQMESVEIASHELKCIDKDCQKKYNLQDVKNIAGDLFDKKCNIALNRYLMQQSQLYKYCHKCNQIIRKEGRMAWCSTCNKTYCSQCTRSYHPEYPDCDFADEHERKNNEYLRLHTKPCPQCRVPIEKSSGCHHMTCTTCHIHFCWQCGVFTAKNGDDVYIHMGTCNVTPEHQNVQPRQQQPIRVNAAPARPIHHDVPQFRPQRVRLDHDYNIYQRRQIPENREGAGCIIL